MRYATKIKFNTKLSIIFCFNFRIFFYGFISSLADRQPVAGAFRDERHAIYVTRAGRGDLWLDPLNPDVIEVCGGRGNSETLMATCGRMKRSPEATP